MLQHYPRMKSAGEKIETLIHKTTARNILSLQVAIKNDKKLNHHPTFRKLGSPGKAMRLVFFQPKQAQANG